jgi:hypothetical protein
VHVFNCHADVTIPQYHSKTLVAMQGLHTELRGVPGLLELFSFRVMREEIAKASMAEAARGIQEQKHLGMCVYVWLW